MRTKGAKNRRPAYMSTAAINRKAEKLKTAVEDFVEKSSRNHDFKRHVNYARLRDMVAFFEDLSTFKPE